MSAFGVKADITYQRHVSQCPKADILNRIDLTSRLAQVCGVMGKFSMTNFTASFANLGIIFFAALSLLFFPGLGLARDLDGKYANSPLKQWFESLASRRGPCCSVADGQTVEDVDWDTKDGKYRVRLDGQWIEVPPDALVTVSNKFGLAMVWPYKDYEGRTQIRCFIPGAGG